MQVDRRGTTLGAAILAVGLGFLAGPANSMADDEVPKEVKSAIDKMADLIAKGRTDEAKKAAAELAKKGGMSADKPGSLEDLMHAFGPRSLNGYAIESRLKNLVEGKELTSKQMAADGTELRKLAQLVAAIAEVTSVGAPTKNQGKDKTVANWNKWAAEMRDTATELDKAVEKKDSRAVKNAARKLDSSCRDCHKAFR